MKKPQTNYAFIDGTNLHLTMINSSWKLEEILGDWRKDHPQIVKQ